MCSCVVLAFKEVVHAYLFESSVHDEFENVCWIHIVEKHALSALDHYPDWKPWLDESNKMTWPEGYKEPRPE
jgi:hypothetical protein